MKLRNHFYICLLWLLSAYCSPVKNIPATNVSPDISYHTTVNIDTSNLFQWLDFYKDPTLQLLIKETLDSNLDLLTAGARVEEARAQTAIIKSNLYPQFGYQAQAGGGDAKINAQKTGGGYDGGRINVYGTINWEIDVWGKFRHASKSAQAQFLSSIYNRNALQVSLIAETASQYFILLDLDNRLAIANSTLQARKEYTKLISAQFDTGYISELDKLQAIQQESSVAAVIPSLQRQIVITENAIRLLSGKGPGTITRNDSIFQQNYFPEIPVGLSSQLLQRRPDIQSAAQSLKAQSEQVWVAQANRFPFISLTGLLGFASPQLSSLVSNKSFVANGFGSITGPIFNFNKLRNAVTSEQKRTEEVYYQYQKTIFSAFSDVDNALTILQTYSEEYDQLKIQVDAAAKALTLSGARYDRGFTPFLEVLIQQNTLFSAQLQQSAALQGRLNAAVMLYKALGGGW